MDKISEILKNVKDRLSSPFIFSFILSWFLHNWQVTIALVWYDTEQIKRAGYASIFDLVSCKTDSAASWLFPLMWAALYTLVWPFIRMLFSWVQAKASTLGEKLVRNATQETRISAKRYFQFKDEYDKQLKILKDSIDSEQVIKGELEKQTTELLKVTQEKIDLVASHSEKERTLSEQLNKLSEEKANAENSLSTFLRNLYDVDFMDGTWEIFYRSDGEKKEVKIRSGLMIDTDLEDDHYRIGNFYYDTITKKISFIKFPVDLEETSDPQVPYSSVVITHKNHPNIIVTLSGEKNFFQGKEDNIRDVTYTRLIK